MLAGDGAFCTPARREHFDRVQAGLVNGPGFQFVRASQLRCLDLVAVLEPVHQLFSDHHPVDWNGGDGAIIIENDCRPTGRRLVLIEQALESIHVCGMLLLGRLSKLDGPALLLVIAGSLFTILAPIGWPIPCSRKRSAGCAIFRGQQS
jgi:hypothetical protein